MDQSGYDSLLIIEVVHWLGGPNIDISITIKTNCNDLCAVRW